MEKGGEEGNEEDEAWWRAVVDGEKGSEEGNRVCGRELWKSSIDVRRRGMRSREDEETQL